MEMRKPQFALHFRVFCICFIWNSDTSILLLWAISQRPVRPFLEISSTATVPKLNWTLRQCERPTSFFSVSCQPHFCFGTSCIELYLLYYTLSKPWVLGASTHGEMTGKCDFEQFFFCFLSARKCRRGSSVYFCFERENDWSIVFNELMYFILLSFLSIILSGFIVWLKKFVLVPLTLKWKHDIYSFFYRRMDVIKRIASMRIGKLMFK